MGKPKKVRAERKKVKNLRPRVIDAAKAEAVAGGKVSFQDIHFTTSVNKASPNLG